MAAPGGFSARFHEGQSLPEYRVVAHNGAVASDNKIHDNVVAKQYGFSGGLVPGVTGYAYMTRPIMDALGPAWLERGTMTARFIKPFYEGDLVTCRATVSAVAGDRVEFALEALNQSGEVCAIGTAALGDASPAPDLARFPKSPLPAARPPVSYEALAAVDVLGSLSETVEAAQLEGYLDEVGDDLALYRGADAVVPSGYLIRRANTILVENVVLAPWIHVSSEVTHHSIARPGEALSTRGRVTSLFDRKGHRFVDYDVLIVAGEARPVMTIHHTAIYDVRKVGAAGG
ncbi:MAG: hypothetical protein HY875_06010 [Chloroflexi bacterium]|nr:hypothetical protein [Chloroflexota bacterium]